MKVTLHQERMLPRDFPKFGCFLVSTLAFWDVRFLLFFWVIAAFVLFTSGVKWVEIRRAFLFIIGFIFFFAILTFLTGRGGAELYTEEHLIRQFKASFSIFGWTPTLNVTVERAFYAVIQLIRVSSIAIMTMFCAELAVPLPSAVKTVEINWFHLVETTGGEATQAPVATEAPTQTPFPVHSHSIFDKFHVFYYQPEVYFLDPSRIVLQKWVGVTTEAEFESVFQQYVQ